ncbi:hypothetical protein J4E08_14335 [Sagittula sp. NFXS13]|uniref:Putative outer membrane protein n=1 Tax=Sagittula marina TaxID=943940 RepID=A0A7W6DQZ5_9RHOB|nr:hypothetical protein [Sagittula marina]MBB3986111.1 putative outer membrane protein [Sagittula marina]
MKFAKIAAVALLAAAPFAASAQEADPFVSTQLSAIPALAIIGGVAVVVAVAAAESKSDSSTGTND